jgi:tripeptidyl-peptidase-1
VTAIGATENEGPPVTAAYFSAGGFSNYFARPSWQDKVVYPYLTKLVSCNDSKIGLFNQFGHAIPDISAVGSGFSIEYGGGGMVVQGTSASTPVVAAMIALINDARLRAEKPSLGWLNPLLYSVEVRKY